MSSSAFRFTQSKWDVGGIPPALEGMLLVSVSPLRVPPLALGGETAEEESPCTVWSASTASVAIGLSISGSGLIHAAVAMRCC